LEAQPKEFRTPVSKSTVLSNSDDEGQVKIKEIKFGQVISESDRRTEASQELIKEKRSRGQDNLNLIAEDEEVGESESEASHMESKCIWTIQPEATSEEVYDTEDSRRISVLNNAAWEERHPIVEEFLVIEESVDQEKKASDTNETEDEGAGKDQVDTMSQPLRMDESHDKPLGEGLKDISDQRIEERIAAFEEDLAMQCPMCLANKVQAKETTLGKTYYMCTEKDCHFISWGKPYHLACPECQNPFLVEKRGRDGKTTLKCPRATCSYWQNHPSTIPETFPESRGSTKSRGVKKTGKPGRRVVKRRVVRKKR
jgi:hypothetical protein